MITLKKFSKLLATALVCTMAIGTVHATPTRWTFTAIISAEQTGYAWVSTHVGQTVTGWLMLDPAQLLPNGTNGSTYSNGYYHYVPPYADPMQLRGSATGGSLTANVGGGIAYDNANLEVYKALANTYNGVTTYQDIYGVTGESCAGPTTGPCSGIGLFTSMNTDGVHASGIFNNSTYASPDLSLDQAAHWLTPGTNNYGWITNGQSTEYLTLTSVTQDVPEPGTLALAGIALVGVALARRKHAR